jgi:hypothetical protein
VDLVEVTVEPQQRERISESWMDLEPISAGVNRSGCSAIRSMANPGTRTGSSPSGVLTPPDPVPVHEQPFCPASLLVLGRVVADVDEIDMVWNDHGEISHPGA